MLATLLPTDVVRGGNILAAIPDVRCCYCFSGEMAMKSTDDVNKWSVVVVVVGIAFSVLTTDMLAAFLIVHRLNHLLVFRRSSPICRSG